MWFIYRCLKSILGGSYDDLVYNEQIVEFKCTLSIGRKSLEDTTLDRNLQFYLQLTETSLPLKT